MAKPFWLSFFIARPLLLIVFLICLAGERVASFGEELEYLSGRNEAGLKTLRLVQFIHRHGKRNQKKSLMAISPLFKQSPPMDEYEQLTQEGKEEMFQLGQVLRRRYDGFLERSYDLNQILVKSKDSDRCIQSAAALLLRLFPEVRDAPSADSKWNLIPVHSITDKVDNILDPTSYPCPRMRQLDAEDASKANARYGPPNQDLFDYVNQVFNASVTNLFQLFQVFAGWSITVGNGIQVPASNSAYHRIQALWTQTLFDKMKSIEEQELSVGPLFSELIQQASDLANGQAVDVPRRAFQYSTGIEPIFNLMYVLGLPVYTLMPYGAAFILELHQELDHPPTLQFFYRNRTDAPPFELISSACGTPCTLKTIKSKFAYLLNVTQNYDDRCVARE